MATAAENAYKSYAEAVGTTEGTGDWFTVDQDQIDVWVADWGH